MIPMMGGYGNGWGNWVVMIVMMSGLWVLVAVAIVAVLRWPWGRPDRAAEPPTDHATAPALRHEASPAARALLEQRFAAGDIDEAEFRSRLAALMGRS
ncbi:hypothetical protein [Janibacter sp. G56]|uniref:hypothetical protein n=1 Tax=Janibacter sp. G56 TaxID=3418717 RepID=UPI003D0263C4